MKHPLLVGGTDFHFERSVPAHVWGLNIFKLRPRSEIELTDLQIFLASTRNDGRVNPGRVKVALRCLGQVHAICVPDQDSLHRDERVLHEDGLEVLLHSLFIQTAPAHLELAVAILRRTH